MADFGYDVTDYIGVDPSFGTLETFDTVVDVLRRRGIGTILDFVPAADRDAVAQAVISLLGDTVRRRAMGEAGRARFEEHFSFAQFRDRLDAMLRREFPPRAGK
jgi:glycosidase